MRAHFTWSAEADLERIADQIATVDPERARLTVRGLRAAARAIGAMPRAYSPVPTSPGVRKKSVRPYVILYSIIEGEVVLMRIAHERSDWISLV